MLALFVKVPSMQRLRKIHIFSRIPNILWITVSFHTSSLVTCVNRLYIKCNLNAETRFIIVKIYRKIKVTIRPGFPRTVLFSGSCPGCHGVLDFVLDLKSSDASLANVYLSQSQYVLNVRLLTAMTK